MLKTLGGDRLGSGNRMKVELHNYERSTHNMGFIWRSSMAAGTLVPFMNKVALPGDTWDLRLNADVKTHPTIGPLFGSAKLQLDVFLNEIRLYNGLLHNNALNLGRNISQVKFPVIEMTPTEIDFTDPNLDLDNCQINPSSLLAYIGIRGVGNAGDLSTTRTFNALGILIYWDNYKNFYANKQEEIGAVIHTPSVANIVFDTISVIDTNNGLDAIPAAPAIENIVIEEGYQIQIGYTTTPPDPTQIMINTNGQMISAYDLMGGTWTDNGTELQGYYDQATYGDRTIQNWRFRNTNDLGNTIGIVTFPLTNLDDMRNYLLQNFSTVAPVKINGLNKAPYRYLYEQPEGIPNVLSSQEGLGLKTYQSDIWQNWLNTEWIDGPGGITSMSAVSTAGGSFTIDQLNLSKKVWDLLNRIAVAGGSVDDWIDAVWSHERYRSCETGMYMGGLIKEIVFQEVVSNSQSQTEQGSQPLGTLAGKGILSNKHKGGNVTIKVDSPSYIQGIVSITPRIDYSQGNAWDVNLQTLDDLHKPAFDQIGFQESINEYRAWWDTNFNGAIWVQSSAGKQPAWMNYMTDFNKTYGNFAIATNEMFMTFNRRYENDGSAGILDLTTYIDPTKFNYIFAETALDAQNYWVQIAVDATVRRKMSHKIMPNL